MALRTPRTGFRIGALPSPGRALAIAAVAIFGLAPFVAAALAAADGWQASGDVAIIGLRAGDTWGGERTSDAPLLGHPTTADRFTGSPSYNPGPVQYWTLGLTSLVLGAQLGLVVGAALVNAAALVGALWLAFRRGGPELLALTSVGLAGLVLSLGPASLWDPFNSEMATYPMVATLFAAWSVVTGDLRVAPVLAVAASFAAQVHVAGAAFVAPLAVACAASLVVVARRHPAALRKARAHLLGAVGILVLLWAPVVVHELTTRPSNVAALWKTATADRPRIGLVWVLERLVAAVAPVPAFLHRGDFVADASVLQVLLACLLIGGAGSLALWVRSATPRSTTPWLVALITTAMLTSVWMGSGQPPLAAFRADGNRWLWVVSLGVWLAGAWGTYAWRPGPREASVRQGSPFLAAGAAAVVLVASFATGGIDDVRDGDLMPAMDQLADEVIEALPADAYLLKMEGDQALLTFGPALAYRLEDAGFAIRVEDNDFGRAFGPGRTRASGAPDPLRVTSVSTAEPNAGEELIAEVPIDLDDPDGPTIKVFAPR